MIRRYGSKIAKGLLLLARLNGVAYRNATDIFMYMAHSAEPEDIARPRIRGRCPASKRQERS